MAVYSVNQVRHLYVAKSLKTAVAQLTTAGDILPKADAAKTTLYFQYYSPAGLVESSDRIHIPDVTYAKATSSEALARKLDRYQVALDPAINAGAPVAGQDYLLRLAFRQYAGISPEDQYWKFGMVHAVSGMTAEQFYQSMLASLKNNMAREESKLVNLSLAGEKAAVTMTANSGITVTANNSGTSGNSLKFAIASVSAASAGVAASTTSGVTTITASLTAAARTVGDLKTLIATDPGSKDLVTVTGTDAAEVEVEAAVALTGGSTTGIIIEEAEQPWILGVMPQGHVPFAVQPTNITFEGDERIWGTVTALAPVNSVQNGHDIADLEYFTMGARGDLYRNMGWPNVIHTAYLVDPTRKYDVLDISYCQAGGAEDVQKSPRTLTLVAADDGNHTVMNALIGAINTASGLAIAALS